MIRRGHVLLVTPVFTNPPVQGNAARILAFGRELKSRGFVVDVVHYVLDRHNPEIAAAMRHEWNAVYEIAGRPHKPMAFPACWGIDDWCPDEVCSVVESLCTANSFDAVIVNYVWMSRALTVVEDLLRILDTHDLFGNRHRVAAEIGLNPNWYFTTLEQENSAFERADIVIGIQAVETAEIARRTSARAITIGHPVAPWYLQHTDSSVKLAMFGYFGSGNPWNVRSVARLDQSVGRIGGLDWALAGAICDAGLDLVSRPVIFGAVERPEDFYRHIECGINPMSPGTGLKIKTIETLAYGRPIIGTGAAFDGLDPVHPFHNFGSIADLADGAKDYARSESLRLEVHAASRELYIRYTDGVEQQYQALANLISKGL